MKIKIKIINPVPELEPAVVDAMDRYLAEAVMPETELAFVSVERGFRSIETETQGLINGAEILKTVAKLQSDDCDGIFINYSCIRFAGQRKTAGGFIS